MSLLYPCFSIKYHIYLPLWRYTATQKNTGCKTSIEEVTARITKQISYIFVFTLSTTFLILCFSDCRHCDAVQQAEGTGNIPLFRHFRYFSFPASQMRASITVLEPSRGPEGEWSASAISDLVILSNKQKVIGLQKSKEEVNTRITKQISYIFVFTLSTILIILCVSDCRHCDGVQ
jgi:hypothetical protein